MISNKISPFEGDSSGLDYVWRIPAGLFDHHFLHFNAIPVADADEINASLVQVEMLQAVHFAETEDILSHQVEHADLRGLAQFHGEIAV